MNTPYSISALVLLAALVVADASAQTTRPAPESLVESLRAGDWKTRQLAEDALVTAGGDALPAIEAALASDGIDFESRERLESARTRIEQERLLIATRVTVQREFDSPLAAFTFIAQQAGLTVEAPADPLAERARTGGPVKVDFADLPWLAAIDELTARTGLLTEAADTRLRFLPDRPESLRPPTDYAGSAAVTATGARKRETLQFGDDSRRGEVYITLAVELEPKAALVEPTARLLIRKTIDESGKVFRDDQVLGLTRRGANRYITNLTLGTPGKTPKSVSRIEGELQGEIVTRVDQIRVTDLDTLPRSVSLPDGDIELASLQTDEKGSRLVVNVPMSMGNSFGGQVIARGQLEGLQVFDQHGKTMQLARSGAQHRAGLIEYRFTITGPDAADVPTSLSWNVPAQTRDIRIPFKLENLPLPE